MPFPSVDIYQKQTMTSELVVVENSLDSISSLDICRQIVALHCNMHARQDSVPSVHGLYSCRHAVRGYTLSFLPPRCKLIDILMPGYESRARMKQKQVFWLARARARTCKLVFCLPARLFGLNAWWLAGSREHKLYIHVTSCVLGDDIFVQLDVWYVAWCTSTTTTTMMMMPLIWTWKCICMHSRLLEPLWIHSPSTQLTQSLFPILSERR